MLNNIIFYLFIGVIWDIILSLIANYTDPRNSLNSMEKVVNMLAWPLGVIIFTYHFIKTLNNEN